MVYREFYSQICTWNLSLCMPKASMACGDGFRFGRCIEEFWSWPLKVIFSQCAWDEKWALWHWECLKKGLPFQLADALQSHQVQALLSVLPSSLLLPTPLLGKQAVEIYSPCRVGDVTLQTKVNNSTVCRASQIREGRGKARGCLPRAHTL